MRYRETGLYEEILEKTVLVRFDPKNRGAYRIEEFDCGIEDYNDFLIHDAALYVREQLSVIYLLIDQISKDVLGYLALSADSFLLDKDEKANVGLTIPFSTVPAVKIGKLATSKQHRGKYGSYLLYLAVGLAKEMINAGVACRFLSVDADLEFNERTPEFYLANGFVYNEHRQYRSRSGNRSMRFDLFAL